MIEGVIIQSLKVFSDQRGKVMHMLRSNDAFFSKFGEIYFSTINPGIIKGWKKHLKMTQHFVVPVGNVKFVLFDEREKSSTRGEIQEVVIGTENYQLIRIPPLVYYSFKAVKNEVSLIANCTDLIHEPNEVINLDLSDKRIPYNWGK